MRGRFRDDARACIVLGVLILLLGLPWRWVSSPTRWETRPDVDVKRLLRVEVRGDPSVEGIYEVDPGTTVGAFLETLGIGAQERGRENPSVRFRALEDLCAIVLSDRSRWKLDAMSPGRAYLLGAPLDLNRAGVWDLTLLPGVGPVTARKIIGDRKIRGPFGDPRDLARRIPGIPARTLKQIMPLVTTTPLVRTGG